MHLLTPKQILDSALVEDIHYRIQNGHKLNLANEIESPRNALFKGILTLRCFGLTGLIYLLERKLTDQLIPQTYQRLNGMVNTMSRMINALDSFESYFFTNTTLKNTKNQFIYHQLSSTFNIHART